MSIKTKLIKPVILLFFVTIFIVSCSDSTFNPDQLTNQIESGENSSLPLAELNLETNEFRVVSSDQVEWEDTCLGIEQPGNECLPEVTPGYLVVLEGNGLQFKYHADQKGNQVQPATKAIFWTREGGIPGYCDKLIIYLPDTVHACWCKDGKFKSTTAFLQDVLSIDEYEQFIHSLKNFSRITLNPPSSAENEAEIVSFTFFGQGNNHPDEKQQATLLDIPKTILSRLIP